MDRTVLYRLAQECIDDARAAQRLHVGAIERLGVVIEQLQSMEQPEEEAPEPAHLRPVTEPPRLSTIGPARPTGLPSMPMSFSDPGEYPVDEEVRQKILAFNEAIDPDEPAPA